MVHIIGYLLRVTRSVIYSLSRLTLQGNKFSYDTIRSPAFTGNFERETQTFYQSPASNSPTSNTRTGYLPTPVLGDHRRMEYPWRENYQGEHIAQLYEEQAKLHTTAAPDKWKSDRDGVPLRLGFCSGLAATGHSVMTSSYPNYSRPPPIPGDDAHGYHHLPRPKLVATADGVPTYPVGKRAVELQRTQTGYGKKPHKGFTGTGFSNK